MNTTELTVQLPESDVVFLEEFAQRHKTTVSDLIANFVTQLRKTEQEYLLHPDIRKFAGIIPEEIEVKTAYYDYLEEKHK